MAMKSGEVFDMMSDETTQVRMDGDAVKALLDTLLTAGAITEAQKQGCFKEISFETVRIARKHKEDKVAYTPPKLGANITAAAVVDMLGECREKIADLKKDEGILKAGLDVRIRAEERADNASSSTQSADEPEGPTTKEDGIPF